MYKKFNLQKLIDLSHDNWIDPDLIDVKVDYEKLSSMILDKHGVHNDNKVQNVVKSEEEFNVVEEETNSQSQVFLTHWKNAEAVFQVDYNTLKRSKVPGLIFKGVIPEISKKHAMVSIDLGHPKLVNMNLTEEDFKYKRKKFYSTPELLKLSGFSTNQSVYSRFQENERLRIGRFSDAQFTKI